MPVTPTYPGVYIEEVPSGVRTITGVATSITAFIGRAKKGTLDDPTLVQSFADFDRKFGGLWDKSTLSYAVQHYFMNGGKDALIVRVANGALKATITLPAGAGSPLVLKAASEGAWSNGLRVAVDYDTKDAKEPIPKLFNLTVQELTETKEVVSTETFRNLSVDPTNIRYVSTVLVDQSALVRMDSAGDDRPDKTVTTPPDFTAESNYKKAAGDGSDGGVVSDAQISVGGLETTRQGLYALNKADLFNLLCIPPYTPDTDVDATTTLAKAAKYCKDHRAILIVDPPSGWTDADKARAGLDAVRSAVTTDNGTNAAIYFPRLKMPDSLKENRTDKFVPCGAVAGIFARTDSQRGIWKAPAGQEATLSGVREFTYKLDDAQNGTLNPLGLNCLRSFPVYGNVLWGARTLAGADQLASEWKYIPVRRTALYIEESLYRGIQWVVFEPNDEPLWAQIRLNVGAFLNNMFRQGAFQGKTPREAYFVKCDRETTTQNDIDRGIVNILVGFAPLKPAEFVIIKLTQIAGQIQV